MFIQVYMIRNKDSVRCVYKHIWRIMILHLRVVFVVAIRNLPLDKYVWNCGTQCWCLDSSV